MGKSKKKKRKEGAAKRDSAKLPTDDAKQEHHLKNEQSGQGKEKRRRVNSDNLTLSLASKLKRHRGTAESTPAPPLWSLQDEYRASLKKRKNHHRLFLTPSQDDSLFESCQNECYRGFVWEKPNRLPQSLHANFDKAFDAMYNGGLFLFDAVQAGGKKISQTHVTRTLIGNPGSTYRYLGLRLFSHPWSTCPDTASSNGDGDKEQGKNTLLYLTDLGYSREVAQALWSMGRLNHKLTERTHQALKEHVKPHVKDGLVGSASYSLTLVNRMEPSTTKRDLKQDPLYGMGKTSVSWHRDSGLMDFSSIAVYHSLRGEERPSSSSENVRTPWRVALRVFGKDCPTPPLAVPLPSGSLYFLLDDFNHKHEHAVLAGQEQVRYSSTHRVAREGRGTWQYIRDKCQNILDEEKGPQQNERQLPKERNRKLMLVKKIKAEQQLLQEIQFEWLLQWHVQGRLHASLHPYWHEPMKLLSSWYQELESRSIEVVGMLQSVSKRKKKRGGGAVENDVYKDIDTAADVSEDLYDAMIESLGGRIQLERVWKERLTDPFYQSLPANEQPYPCPVLNPITTGSQSKDLKSTLAQLRKWRASFVSEKHHSFKNYVTTTDSVESRSQKPTAKIERGGLTKKEKRKIASNWESLKNSMK